MSLINKSVLILILFSLLFFVIYIFIDNTKNKYVIIEDTYYFLNKNTSQKQILSELKSKKVHISRLNWKLTSLFHKKRFIPKAGEYLIPKNLTVFEIQQIFQNGKTITRNFTLVEGSTAIELKNNLLNNPYLTGEIENLKEGVYKPDTYFFKYGYPRKKLLAKMQKAQEKLLDDIWREKPENFILKNKNDLLILASIIQMESSHVDDAKLVASVFINRLKKKMKLQSDVTLAYGFKINGKKITKTMLKSNNPFNTYYFHGLPPTPISYPGQNAFNSLKYLKETDYLYFVTDGKGRHRFSTTYSLHKKNIKLWKNSSNKDK